MDLMTYALCKGNGGGGGSSNILVITEDSDGILDHTWQEIFDADYVLYSSADSTEKTLGFVARASKTSSTCLVSIAYPSVGGGTVTYEAWSYTCSSPNEHPAYVE